MHELNLLVGQHLGVHADQHLLLRPCGHPPLRVYHVYVPPIKDAQDHLRLGAMDTDEHTIVLGDVNRHHPSWDKHFGSYHDSRHARRGEEVVEWAGSKELAILNDGAATRHDSTRDSAPDLTLVARQLAPRCSWEVLEDEGFNDHRPIQTDIRFERPPIQAVRQRKWSWKSADWIRRVMSIRLRWRPASLAAPNRGNVLCSLLSTGPAIGWPLFVA